MDCIGPVELVIDSNGHAQKFRCSYSTVHTGYHVARLDSTCLDKGVT